MHTEIDFSVLHFYYTWNTHHSLPFPIYRLWHTKPCHQNSLCIYCTLRCIEIQAIIQKLISIRKFHAAIFFIKRHLHTNGLIFICLAILQNPHRRKDDNLFAIYFKVIRTFPHPAKFFSFRNRVYIIPMFLVCTFEKQQSSFSVFYCTSKHHIPAVLFFPDFWISCVSCISDLRILNNRNYCFLIFYVVKLHSIL